jgi:O-methyltransferase
MKSMANLYSSFNQSLRTLNLFRHVGLASGIKAIGVFPKVMPYTMVGRKRLEALYKLVREVERQRIVGDIVECGTCNGGTAAVLGYAGLNGNRERRLWLFDSFEGLPEPLPEDGEKAQSFTGLCLGKVECVEEILKEIHVPRERVYIVKGWFQDTFQTVDIPRIALLHIDADWYESVRLVLERFYDQVQPSGFIVFDDYGFWEGCRKAVDEFLSSMVAPPKLTKIDSRAVYLQKPAS